MLNQSYYYLLSCTSFMSCKPAQKGHNKKYNASEKRLPSIERASLILVLLIQQHPKKLIKYFVFF